MGKTLEKAIENMGARRGMNFSDLLDEFLTVSLCLLCNNPSDRQKKLKNDIFSDDSRKAAFFTALEAYGEEAEGYCDPLGDMFMERVSHGSNGQFFTPDSVCELMSMVVDPHNGTINDPACGSGRTLLAALKKARAAGNDPAIYANDLSFTAAQICLLNLLYNSVKGEVSCGDSLRMNRDHFLYYRLERVLMPDGLWLSTYWQYTLTNVDEVDKLRSKWVTEMLMRGFYVERLNTKKIS